jgi:hypothetical protein
MGERTVADTHNDSFRMPLREPRPGTSIEPKGGPTHGYSELSASSATLRTRLWPGWQPVRLHFLCIAAFGVNVRFCRPDRVCLRFSVLSLIG